MLIPDLITELQDLRYLTWSHGRHSSGTIGTYLKAYETRNGRKLYYKMSDFDPMKGVIGHECVNELIVDRLLSILGVDHVHYQLIHAVISVEGKDYETYVCVSEDYKGSGDSKIAFDDYYEMEHFPNESVLEFCTRKGWEEYFYTMLAVDYLILNRDRHGANIEILRNSASGCDRPAPLFDHGLSLLFSCSDEKEAEDFDTAADIPVQSFLGSKSAFGNLSLIPADKRPMLRSLEERDKSVLLNGLDDVIPSKLRDKIWDMIWSRWCVYESLQHNR